MMSLTPAQDFYRLRREGIGHIERSGNAAWTDYNTHDPGISILEVLAYAITELAYRAGFPIADILASTAPGEDPFADQAFPSARKILTVNPTTSDDLRRRLIDASSVRNAWVQCKTCACDEPFFAWCEDGELVLSHDPSQRKHTATQPMPVQPRGLYDVLLELEPDPIYGDLNDRKVVGRQVVVDGDGRRHQRTAEVRFPAWTLAQRDLRHRLIEGPLLAITVSGPNRTKTSSAAMDDATLHLHWSDVLYIDLDVELADHTVVKIENASLRLFGDRAVRDATTCAGLRTWLGEVSSEGFVEAYRKKLGSADRGVGIAKAVLQSHRNLDEDFCHVDLVEIADIAACADVEVEPAADIELVQARIWFEIERYLDPPVQFWSLEELRAQGEPVEAIFDGPELQNGFLTEQGLQDTRLRSQVRASDILDRLMDIDGVISVDNLRLTAYDAEGSARQGIADPTWAADGTPTFEQNRTSAAWLLVLESDRRPRLHRRLSRFLFASKGLPFLPRLDEAEDTLVQLQGQADRPKLRATDLDLPMPPARRRSMEEYQPVQHSFPLVYGIGPAGLPSTASAERDARALQLKAYLMVYDQLLRNAYAQVARVGELFSLDPKVDQTYFSARFDPSQISRYDEVVRGLTDVELARMVESPTEFGERRNRFLDHLLARFGEQLDEYAMALTDLEGQSAARLELLTAKTDFLRALPRLGHDRGRAFDRSTAPCHPDNVSGLQERMTHLLGLPHLAFTYQAERPVGSPDLEHHLDLVQPHATLLRFDPPTEVRDAVLALLAERDVDPAIAGWRLTVLDGQLLLLSATGNEIAKEGVNDLELRKPGAATELWRALGAAEAALLTDMVLAERLVVATAGSNWRVEVRDQADATVGHTTQDLADRRAAEDLAARLVAWSAHKRAIVVEHLLLRPKFPGDALLPTCSDGPGCGCGCGDEDPYSFRLTYVMPGWTAPFNTNLSMRGYADRTIQEQTPSHLVVKTCWVGNDGFVTDPCDPIVDALADLLAPTAATRDAACQCAAEVHARFAAAAEPWLDEHAMGHQPEAVVKAALSGVLAGVDLTGVPCAGASDPAVRAALQERAVAHFADLALHGFQFERFEAAWCAWADEDAEIDWTAERLQDTVVGLLTAGLITPDVPHAVLCAGAATIVADFGTQFRLWMDEHLDAGHDIGELTDFTPPAVSLVDGLAFAPGVDAAICTLLADRYATYAKASYRLSVLLRALAALRSTYPPATLHDCDEGSDVNPVRLGQTALGSN